MKAIQFYVWVVELIASQIHLISCKIVDYRFHVAETVVTI